MDSWPNLKTVETPVDRGQFEDLMDLWRSWKDKKSANLPRLATRLNDAYQTLTRGKQREFMRVLIAEGLLPEDVIKALKTFNNGMLVKLTIGEEK